MLYSIRFSAHDSRKDQNDTGTVKVGGVTMIRGTTITIDGKMQVKKMLLLK